MKSVDELAMAAYDAYCLRLGIFPMRWSDIDQRTKDAWIAAAQAVRTQIAAVH